MEPISKFVAWQICNEIWLEHVEKPYSLDALRCWVCSTFSKDGMVGRQVGRQPGYRGCVLVNRRYDEHSTRSNLMRRNPEPSRYPRIP